MEIKTTQEIGKIDRDCEMQYEKWVSVDSIKRYFEGCGRDPEGSLILFLKELEKEE